jgi:putative ABC transport system permease protein
MNTVLLALRNLLRNRRRSLATLLAMAIGSASILLFGGYSANIKYSMQTAYVRSGGHLQVQHRDYYLYGSGNPTAYGIAEWQLLLRTIRDDSQLNEMIAVITPTLQFGGLAGNYDAGVSRTIIGNGLVPADINRMRTWNEYALPLESPRFALEGAPADAAIVGNGVARVLQLCESLGIATCPKPEVEAKKPAKAIPSDIAALSALEGRSADAQKRAAQAVSPHPRIELLASNSSGTPNVASLQVIRAENQGFKELDEVYVITQLDQAQRLIYGRSLPKVTSIMLQLKQTARLAAAKARLAELLQEMKLKQPLSVLDFEELNPFYVQTVQLFRTIFSFIFLLIAAIVLFTVGNTMNTAVVERTVEIGTLRAVGLRQHGIRALFIIEGLLLGLAGALLGASFAVLASGIVNAAGLTWLPPGSAEPLPLILRVWGESAMIVYTTVGLVIIAAASAWWPAYRAAKLKIVDALRHV